MKKISLYITGILLVGGTGCTSLSEGQENLPDDAQVTERVILRTDLGDDLRNQMDEQASEINRKRNIEEFNRNLPATTPNTLRPQQLPNAPVDTTTHNINRPMRPASPPPIKVEP